MIQKIRVVGGVAVVTATSTFHPLRMINNLASDLKLIGFEGTVLFDLLAVNGLAENRFASMKFTGQEFDKSTFAVETSVNPNIREEQDSLAKRDETFLLGSVLSASEVDSFSH